MKPSTVTWIRLESKGYPNATVEIQGTTQEHMLRIAKYLLETNLTHKIQITITREPPGKKTEEAKDDALAEMKAFMAQLDQVAETLINES